MTVYIVHHDYCKQSIFASREAAETHAATENAKPLYARWGRAYWRVEERALHGQP